MKAPTSVKVGATAWDGSPTRVEQSAGTRNSCPWPCVRAQRFVDIRTADGYIVGAWCATCDQAITRTEWLSLLEEPEP